MRYLITIITTCLLSATLASAATYYVRTDGGSQAQCTGLVDAAYDGSGTGEACAWRNLNDAMGMKGVTSTVQKISGGDTVIVKNGSYPSGRIIGQYDTGNCLAIYSYDCAPLPIPSGPDAAHPTKILGENWQSCTSRPEIYGVERTPYLINATDSSNVEIQCLELTDHETCGSNYSRLTDGSLLSCNRSGTPPYGDWGAHGIWSDGKSSAPYNTSTNVLVKNVYIHGMGGNGVYASHLTDWTFEDSIIDFNGTGGFQGDTPPTEAFNPYNDEFSGVMTFRNTSVSRNGCIENWEFPGDINKVPDRGCYDATLGGYADGIGVGPIGDALWIFDNVQVNYNKSDGIDLLHSENYPLAATIVRNSHTEGNTGNQIKTQQDTWIENTEIVGNCDNYVGKPYNTEESVVCRGGGAGYVTTLLHGNDVYLINNTWIGTGPVMVSLSYDTFGRATYNEKVWSYNNIFVGLPKYSDPANGSDYYYFHDVTTEFLENDFHLSNNIYYGTALKRYDQCSFPGAMCDQNPLLYSTDVTNMIYDLKISSALSPAIGSGVAPGTVLAIDDIFGSIAIPSTDRLGVTRGVAADRGATEYSADYTTPACGTSNLELCLTEEECEAVMVGGYWWGSPATCHATAEPVTPPTSSGSHFGPGTSVITTGGEASITVKSQ